MLKSRAALPILSFVCILLLLIGFTGKSLSQNADDPAGAAGASASENTKNIDTYVFPKNKVVDVKIMIDPDDFQDMLDNASAEEMKTASVDYNGIHFDNVGVRTKGNLSLRSVVNSDSDRYSFKLSFDEYIDNQTFYGISKINLNNNYSDATYMREFLTYELASEMGLPTPEVSYVNVYVNGELWGFYLAVEQIGDTYLQRNFGNSYGALYKAEMNGSGGDLLWQGDAPDAYPALVQKSKSSNGDVLIDMLNELNNGTDYETYLDVEEALRYVALNVVTQNTDSYLGTNKQNYYLYENNGVFSVLPWDYNMAFGGLGSQSLLIDEPTQGAVADRPLIDKLLQVDRYKESYHTIIREAIEGYLSNDRFQARVQELSDLISGYVEQDPRPFYSYDQFKSGVSELVSSNASRIDNYAQQLDGTLPSSGDGSGSGGGMGGPGGGEPGGGFGGNGRGGWRGGGRGMVGMAPGEGDVPSQSEATAAPAGQAGLVRTAALDAAQNGRQPQQEQQGQNGQLPQQGQQQDQNGQPLQQGRQGQQMGQGGRGPFGQDGMGGGMPGMGNQAKAVDSSANVKEAYWTGGMFILLLLTCLFVVMFRRNRL